MGGHQVISISSRGVLFWAQMQKKIVLQLGPSLLHFTAEVMQIISLILCCTQTHWNDALLTAFQRLQQHRDVTAGPHRANKSTW